MASSSSPLRFGRELGEIEFVVPRLRGVVEQRTVGLADYVFESHAVVMRVGDKFVELVHVSRHVLVMVVSERLLRNVRFESLLVVRQRCERESLGYRCCFHKSNVLQNDC